MHSHCLYKPANTCAHQFYYALAIFIGVISHGLFWTHRLLAQSTATVTTITNQATGSFIDSADGSTKPLESNIVSVQVAEVAGITIGDPTISEPTAATIGNTASPFQGIGGVNPDDILYFDFIITNVGNDPTQFFIPGQPFEVTNGTFDRAQFGAVQIVEVKDGTGTLVPLPNNVTKIDIPAAGANTGDIGILGLLGGAIPANGSIKVRIPVKVTGPSGTTIKVTLGNTEANDNQANTSNQPYLASTFSAPNLLPADVHTQDDRDPNSIPGEVVGTPVGGEKEASRFGQIAIVPPSEVLGFKSVKLTLDRNHDTKINPSETVTWTIDYVNTGTVDIPNFQITDLLPTSVTKSGVIEISIAGTQQAIPILNPNYLGTNTTLGTTDTLFTVPIVFKAGGRIKITSPVTINPGVAGSLSTQAIATGNNLPPLGIKTDNVGQTSDLPLNLQATISIATGSIPQQITPTIDPTTIPVVSNPNILLVKRITAINGSTTKRNGTSLANYEEDPANPYDDNDNTPPANTNPRPATDKWPDTIGHTSSTFLTGAIDGGTIKSHDTIDYTIYFVSTGDSPATHVLLCDRVPDYLTFNPTAFNQIAPAPKGLGGADRGIAVNLSGTLESYTNIADNDIARYFPPGVEPQTVYPSINCGKDSNSQPLINTNGAIVVDLGTVTNAIVKGSSGSYGFVRFQGIVK